MSDRPIPRFSPKEQLVFEMLLTAKEEMYGLELVNRSGGNISRGTIYVILDRMEDKGFVQSRLEERDPGSGPPRRLYQPTGYGLRVYQLYEQLERASQASIIGLSTVTLG